MKNLVRYLCLACIAVACPLLAEELAIVGAKIYPAPDAEAIEQGTVLVRDGRIAAVGLVGDVNVSDGTTIIDGKGAIVVAGFWNSHVHFLALPLREAGSRPAAEIEAALQTMLTRWGFTTVFDIASFNGTAATLRKRIESGEVVGPSIHHVDMPFFPEGGTPLYIRSVLQQIGAPSAEVVTSGEAVARAERQLADGADGVKIFAGAIVGGEIDVLPMDATIARAVVDAAHRAGKPAFAHPTDRRGLLIAIDSGVDVLAHTTPSAGPWDEATTNRVRDANMALIPTLTMFESELKRERAPDDVVRSFMANAVQQVRAFAAAGGDILFGTDVDFIHHVDTRREFELMAEAGLDWRRILASLTTVPARRFGESERKGRIEPGMTADLVLLNSDPADGISGFSDVRMTIRAGRTIFRAGEQRSQQ